MRKVFRFFIPLFVFSFTVAALVAEGRAQVLINEILADPARDWDGDEEINFRDDEWVEIINLGEAVVDLSGYRLADGEGEPVWRYGFSGVLGQGEVRVVYGSESKAWEESNGFPIYGLSLNNSGDRLSLYHISGSETLMVDAFTYTDLAADDDRSVGRSAEYPDIWAIFDAFKPCSAKCVPPGNGCIPTPGQPNACMTASMSKSWGKIKEMYRD
ncbi:MAG: lamin tail domain-containing protein [Candidatus Krumholzibacteria bacterium]|nr:lamin tail domain-containing protein [Candidatus Krumholzibacteria bacterium]